MVENKKTVEEICTSMVDFLEEDKMSVFSSWISVLLSELKNQLEVLPKKQTRRVAGIVQPTTSGSRVVSLKPSSVDADSLKKRKERFGLENPSVDDEIVKKRRAERFKIQKEETKKQKKDVSSLLGPPVTKEQAQLDVKDAEDQVRLSIQKNRGSIPRPPPAPASGIYYPPLPAGYPNYMCYPPYHHGYGGRPPRGRGGNWAAWNNDPSYGIPSAHQHQGGYNYPRHPRPVFANKTWVREEQGKRESNCFFYFLIFFDRYEQIIGKSAENSLISVTFVDFFHFNC